MELYHVLNRGTDKRAIAMDDRDRKRFVIDLFMMNDKSPVDNMNYHFSKTTDLRGPYAERRRRAQLVTVHAWCLMGNHYHLLLSERAEGGLSKFLMKFNVAYTKYFNERHKRSGALFQGKTKRVLLKTERQYLYILPYIHLNPLDFMKGARTWRVQCPANQRDALEWIRRYRWSSYRNYAGEDEFSEVLEGSNLYRYRADHIRELRHFLKSALEPNLININLE